MIPAPDANDPTLGEAAAALARAEAEEGLSQAEAPAAAPTTESGETATDPASGATEKQDQTATTEPAAGTPATEEQQKTNSTEQKTTPPKDPKTGQFVKQESRYEKAKGRLGKEFEEAKALKAEALKLQEQVKSDRAAFEKQQQDFRAAQAKATQPKHGPDHYDQAATAWDAEAQAIEDRAKKIADDLEGKGEYDQAEKRLARGKEEAMEKRVLARKARAYAAELRANPPQAPEAADKEAQAKAEAQLEASRKEWLTKAGQDFPLVVKAGSPEKAAFDEFIQQNRALILGPDGKVKDPQAVYYAARLVTAETSAARASAMEQEMAGLRAKVKELNEKLSISADDIGGGNLTQRKFEELSDAEQEAQLRAEAAQRDR